MRAEYVFGESVQSFLWAHFDKDAGACFVEGTEPFHKLDRSRDLLGKNIDHLGHDIRALRIKLAVHVSNERDARRLQVEALEHATQRLTRRGDDGGVER